MSTCVSHRGISHQNNHFLEFLTQNEQGTQNDVLQVGRDSSDIKDKTCGHWHEGQEQDNTNGSPLLRLHASPSFLIKVHSSTGIA